MEIELLLFLILNSQFFLELWTCFQIDYPFSWMYWWETPWQNYSLLFAGDSGIPICVCTGSSLWNHTVRTDSVWVDGCQVPPLHFLPVFHSAYLHIMGNADCCPDPKPSSCSNRISSSLWNLESICRLFDSSSSMFTTTKLFAIEFKLEASWSIDNKEKHLFCCSLFPMLVMNPSK